MVQMLDDEFISILRFFLAQKVCISVSGLLVACYVGAHVSEQSYHRIEIIYNNVQA
jgi:hypothetical protein